MEKATQLIAFETYNILIDRGNERGMASFESQISYFRSHIKSQISKLCLVSNNFLDKAENLTIIGLAAYIGDVIVTGARDHIPGFRLASRLVHLLPQGDRYDFVVFAMNHACGNRDVCEFFG